MVLSVLSRRIQFASRLFLLIHLVAYRKKRVKDKRKVTKRKNEKEEREKGRAKKKEKKEKNWTYFHP